MTSINKMMYQIINGCRTQGEFHTHTSMIKPFGKLNLSRDNVDTLFNLISTPKIIFGITEKPQEYLPVIVDVDIKIKSTDSKSNLYDNTQVSKLITIYQQVLSSIVVDINNDMLTCVLLEKPPYTITKNNIEYKKNGFHLHFPNLFLNKIQQEIHLIPRVKKILDEQKIFDIPSKLLIDDCVTRNPWLLYGARKEEHMDTYTVSKIFDYKCNEISLTTAFNNYSIYNSKEQKIDITPDNVVELLPRILSIIPFGRETQEVKAGLISIEKQIFANEKPVPNNKYINKKIDIKDVKNLVSMLSQDRADTYLDWLKVGWCLHSINDDDEYLDIWKSFSSKSESYDEGECDYQWLRMNKKDFTFGSLRYWAKLDNKDAYQKYLESCSESNIEQSLSGGHSDLSAIFTDMYARDNIKFIGNEMNSSFYRWHETKKLWILYPPQKCLGLINKKLLPLYDNLSRKIYEELEDTKDEAKEKTLSDRLKRLQKMISNLKQAPYVANVYKFVRTYDIDNDFESKIINRSSFELPLKDGLIINLQTLVVRNRCKEDYFSFELPVTFLGEDYNFTKNVLPFMKSITLNSEGLIDYHRRMWGYMMTGSIIDRSLHIMYGNGCNGKSSIVNIFKNITGAYSVNLDEDTIINKTSAGAKPELMDLLHSRCGILPESEKEEKINSKRVKTITGDDEISARHLYAHIVKFKTQCKPIFPTNFKPTIDIEDKAILDRIKLIPFLANFEKTKTNSDYITKLQTNHLDEFFTWFCTGAKDWINGAELIQCDEMKYEMDKYIEENDPVTDFLNETFDIITKKEYGELDKETRKLWQYKKTLMHSEYCGWKTLNNSTSYKKVEFNTMLAKRVEEIIIKGTRFYLCKIKVLQNDNHNRLL